MEHLVHHLERKRAELIARREAHQRWGQVYGWCQAMEWVYGIYGWSKISRKALASLVKKLERSKPRSGSPVVVIKKVTKQQRAFLRWSCEHFGFGFRED